MQLPPEEPNLGPWKVESVREFVRRLADDSLNVPARPHVVAIDGRSASGKTTLATLISRAVLGSVVVHTDDIPSTGNWLGRDAHSPPHIESATQRSFYDWTERLLENVLMPARTGQAVRYRPQAWEDWFREEGAIEVPSGCPTLILEGVGAGRRELTHAVDAVVWVQSDIEQSKTRGIARDGGDAEAEIFWERWMAEEYSFLADQRPWERANVVVTGTSDLVYDPSSHVVVSIRDT